MFKFASLLLASAMGLGGLAHGAHAQALASGDDPQVLIYSDYQNGLWFLEGANQTLTFKTTKANEVVQLSFSASQCGIYQGNNASASVLNSSSEFAGFQVDGALVGQPHRLCAYSVLPQGFGMVQSTATIVRQKATIAAPGNHSVAVNVTISPTTNDGTFIFPVFGDTHFDVSK